MYIKDQVVSLELARELKELGLEQDSWISWIYYSHESLYGMSKEEISRDIEFEWGLDCELCHNVDYIEKYAAPTVAELGEMLPEGYRSYYYNGHPSGGTWMCNDGEILGVADANTEANARAKMLAYLIKEEFIKVEDIK